MNQSLKIVLSLFLVLTFMSVLNFTTYNSNGLGSGRKEYIRELFRNCNFLLLQEHWLFHEQLHKLRGDIGNNVNIHGVSGMESDSLLLGRPHGGVAIAWYASGEASVTPVQWKSKRVCAVTIRSEPTEDYILLINVYMPTDSGGRENLREFNSVLQEISAIVEVNNAVDIIIGGDLNTDFSRLDSAHTRAFLNFLEDENLICGFTHDSRDVDHTYESKATGGRSLIDHFIVSESVFNKIEKYSVLHKGYNTSDHSSLHMELITSLRNLKPGTELCLKI
jgi:exonuclease III